MTKTLEAATPPTEAGAIGMTPRDLVFGAVGLLMVMAAVALLFVGGDRDGGSVAVAVPPLTLVEPAAGAEVSGPVHVVFDVPGEIQRLPTGWGVGELHLHLEVNGREFMPGPADIQAMPGGTYRWTLPGLPPGEHELRLFWSGADHSAISEGASVPTIIRSSGEAR